MRIELFSKELIKPVAKLCRQNMEHDIMPDFLLKEKTVDDPDFKPEMTLVGFNDNSSIPTAFIMGVIRQRAKENLGYIKLICVDSNERKRGFGRELFNKIKEQFVKNNVKRIRIYESYPNYLMPGVDVLYTEALSFFGSLGFKKFGETSNMIVDMLSQDFDSTKEEALLQTQSIICRRAQVSDKAEVMEWGNSQFPNWQKDIEEAFKNNPVSLFVASTDGKVKGFSAHEVNNKGTGWFGPLGIDDSLRRKGIGGVLLRKSLKDMKEIGYTKVIIPWVGQVPFYIHYAHARVNRIFWRYEKVLG